MSPETVQAIQTALAPVAEKIGQGAQFGWESVLKQQLIIGIQDFAELAIIIPATILFAILAFRWVREDDMRGSVLLIGALAILGTFCVMYNIEDGLGHIINPSYYALDFFIHLTNTTK